MRKSSGRLFAFLVLSWVCPAQDAELTSLRLLAQKLHGAYAARDVEAVVSLWSDQSPQKASQREAIQKLFTSSAILEIRVDMVRGPELEGDRARLRIDREVTAVPGSSIPGAGQAKLVLECVREGYEWKIRKESSAVEDLAARLAVLPATEKPDGLLAANEDLIGADLAMALNDRGAAARNHGDLKNALAVLTLARGIAERAGAVPARAAALNHIGLVYQDQGDYAPAVECYRASLASSEELRDDAGTSRTLTDLSGIYSLIGELTVASDYLDRSLAIAERLQNDRLIANVLGGMAILHARRGDYLRALSLFQKSHDLLEAGNDQRGLAASLNNIGNVYLWQGDLARSQDYFQRELELATSTGLKPLVAVAWMGLGRVAEFSGDLRGAIASYEHSLAVLNQTNNRPFAASVLTFIGSAYSMLGDQEKAVEYFQKGLQIQKAIGVGSEAALTMGRIAEVYNRKGDFHKALEAAGEARNLADASGLREALWRADLQAGRAAQEAGDAAQAETLFRHAIATIEALRQDVGGSVSEQESFFETKLEPYQRLLGLLVASGRNAEAEYAERAKARVLLDVFQNGRAELTALMSPEERQHDQALRVHLASLNTQLARAQSDHSPAQLSGLTADLNRARLESDAFENDLYIRHPQWKLHSGAVEPVGIDQALALMPEAATALIEFVVTDDKLYVFAAEGGPRMPGAQSLRTFTVPISRDALAERVRHLQKQLAARDLAFRSTASALYRLLIAPAGLDFARQRHLVLVPDDVLWELPFQALMNPEGQYLLEDCAVSYAPSLTALKTMIAVKRQRKRSPAGADRAMGNPASGRNLEGQVKDLYRGEAFGGLPLCGNGSAQPGSHLRRTEPHLCGGRGAREPF